MSDEVYETRVLSMIVTIKGKSIFDDSATEITIVDEAAGEFIEVSQDEQVIRIDEYEWPSIRACINKMISKCRE